MKHSICGFNHAALVLNYKCDYDDAQIIRCIIDFMETGKMNKVQINNKFYFWVCYSWLLDELIGLKCKDKRGLAKRMDRYVESGLMEKHVENGNRTYYRFVENSLNNLLSFPQYPIQKNVTPVTPVTTPLLPELQPPVTPVTTIDPSSINPSTKDQYNIPGSSPELQDQEGGTVTNRPLSDHTVSTANLEPKKEESSGKEERKLTNAEILFQYWLSFKNMVQHKELTARVRDKVKVAFREDSLESLKAAVENYSKVLAAPEGTYFYTYRSSFEDFFRAGINKTPPYKRFLPEMDPLENLKKKQNFNSGYAQQAQEEPEVDSRVEQERFTETRALNALVGAVEKYKNRLGEDGKKWREFFMYACPSGDNNEFLKWIWDMIIKNVPFSDVFETIHTRIKNFSGLTYDTYKADMDKTVFRVGTTTTRS